MQLPTFLGIGTPKAGSTWIYELLKTHPQVWMSDKRAEIRFFDENYDKGLEWYRQFFPESGGHHYRQLGEFSPQYLYSEEAIARIAKLGTVNKLIVCCRNPVERAFSHYKFFRRVFNYKGSFENSFTDYPFFFDRGCYTKYMDYLLTYFPKESVLLLTFEDLFKDIEETKRVLADFLEIDNDKFSPEAGHEKVNKGFMPKFKTLYSMGIKTGQLLRKYDLYRLEHVIKNSKVRTLLSKKNADYQITEKDRLTKLRLYERYHKEFDKLEKTTVLNVKKWRAMEEQLKREIKK